MPRCGIVYAGAGLVVSPCFLNLFFNCSNKLSVLTTTDLITLVTFLCDNVTHFVSNLTTDFAASFPSFSHVHSTVLRFLRVRGSPADHPSAPRFTLPVSIFSSDVSQFEFYCFLVTASTSVLGQLLVSRSYVVKSPGELEPSQWHHGFQPLFIVIFR